MHVKVQLSFDGFIQRLAMTLIRRQLPSCAAACVVRRTATSGAARRQGITAAAWALRRRAACAVGAAAAVGNLGRLRLFLCLHQLGKPPQEPARVSAQLLAEFVHVLERHKVVYQKHVAACSDVLFPARKAQQA